jgi:prolipoprotein diacylglyceryltransferase/protein-S-isoprenylcysteine O-methyltransferase Ste14
MNTDLRTTIEKILYGFGFVVVLPLLLILWSRATESIVRLPIIGSPMAGTILACLGIGLMGAGMITLTRYGDGLPMNAFPPKRFVSRGVYRLMAHPIYVGFSLACVGVAIANQSSSGLWLVSPIMILCCVALVQGYEKQDMEERLGTPSAKPILHLPGNSDVKPSPGERFSVILLVLLPWLLIYEAVVALGITHDAIVAFMPFEANIPVLEWTELFYASTYLLVVAVPFLVNRSRDLRRFSVAGLLGTGCIALCFLVLPMVAPPRSFVPTTWLGELLMWERSCDSVAAAFPSFHVFWAILAVNALGKSFPKSKRRWHALGLFIALSCVTTGMHAIADVVVGALAGWMCLCYDRVWRWLRTSSEHIANSWKEWRIGPVRIINHGAYPGVGCFIGLLIVGMLAGPASAGYTILIAFSSLVTAGMWAQIVEGSPSLLRPYGYYGGVLGVFIGGLIVFLLGGNVWLMLGAFAVAGPVIQSFGRVRCLVQGCCHGHPSAEIVGIRYRHPRSRVCRLSRFANIPVHPTPLYSILWNVVTGLILARVWSLHAAPTFVAGLYLILNGLGRFVEESYRGEPQTPILGRLRLYHLMALLSIVVGAGMTTISSDVGTPSVGVDSAIVIAAALFGIFTWFALGVDFPDSNRRFARLV